MEILRLDAPVHDKRVLSLLWHKGSPWLGDVKNRLDGQYADSRDHFFVACNGDQLAAHVWYNVSATDPRLGVLGHVYTRPEDRRRGLASRLLRAAMDHFVECGGKVMQLNTSNADTLPLYQKLGYATLFADAALHAMDWHLRWPAESSELIEPWFAPGAGTVRPLGPKDLPQYCLLYNAEYGTHLKNFVDGVGTGVESEFAFIGLIEKIAQRQATCFVLENDQTIVGIASLAGSGATHQSHIGTLDVYVHPNYRPRAGELLQTALDCRQQLGLQTVYALAVDQHKRQLFTDLRFQRTATLDNHYRIRDQYEDCELYRV